MRTLSLVLLSIGISTPALAQVPRVLLEEGAPFAGGQPGEVVDQLHNVEVTEQGAYAVVGRSTDGSTVRSLILGDFGGGPPTVLRRPVSVGGLVQTTFGRQVGIGGGMLAYSASMDDPSGGGNGGEAVFLDSTMLSISGGAVPSIPGATWGPLVNGPLSLTDQGDPYWRQRFFDTAAEVGVFAGVGASPVILLGQSVPGFSNPLSWDPGLLNQFFRSGAGGHDIGIVALADPVLDQGVYLDGQAATAGGISLEASQAIPAAAGGLPGEVWDSFQGTAVNESGRWAIGGASVQGPILAPLLMIDGAVVHRRGDVLDGAPLGDNAGPLRMNEDGDLVWFWQLDDASQSGAVFLNDDLLVQAGDPVDRDGDGFADLGATVRRITAFTGFDLSGRTGEFVDVQVILQLDVAGARLDTLSHIRARVGDLRLTTRPALVVAGQMAHVRLRGAKPSSAAVPFVTSVNGASTWIRLPSILLDGSGAGELAALVPTGLGNLDLELLVVGHTPAGKVGLSNLAPLSLR